MTGALLAAGLGAAAGTGIRPVRRLVAVAGGAPRGEPPGRGTGGERWFPVTVNCPPERLAPGGSPSAESLPELSLDRAPEGYELFERKKDGCVRAVFRPDAA